MNRQRQQLKPSPLLCALAGLVILVWTLGAEGQEGYSYNNRGDASSGQGGKYIFNTSGDQTSVANPQAPQPLADKDNHRVSALPIAQFNGSDPRAPSDSGQNQKNAPSASPANATTDRDSSPSGRNLVGIRDSHCHEDNDCKAVDPNLMCCFEKDGDALDSMGTCQLKEDCKQDGGNKNNPPSSPPSDSGRSGDNGNPFQCREDKECTHFCDHQGNTELILIPKCNLESGQCRCDQLQKYQCRNQSDCVTWFNMPSSERSTGCDSAENFKCEGATENGLGECICQSGNQSPSGESCAGKKCGERCDGCNPNGRLSGECSCVKQQDSGTLVCVQADLPRC